MKKLFNIKSWFITMLPAALIIAMGVLQFKDAVLQSVQMSPHPQIIYLIAIGFVSGVITLSMALQRCLSERSFLLKWSGKSKAEAAEFLHQFSSHRSITPLLLVISSMHTFVWNSGDAVAGSVTTDTIKDFSAWNGSSGDKIDISSLLSALGYQRGSSVLSDWVSFTAASGNGSGVGVGNTAARIDIDTGAGTNVIQTIVLENASLGTNTTLQNLLDNRVLVA